MQLTTQTVYCDRYKLTAVLELSQGNAYFLNDKSIVRMPWQRSVGTMCAIHLVFLVFSLPFSFVWSCYRTKGSRIV